MANATWREASNECNRLARLPEVKTDAQFNDDSKLEDGQVASKWYTRYCHNILTIKSVKDFARRAIEFNTEAGKDTYDLDPGVNPACISYRSFFLDSPPGTTQAIWNRELSLLEEDDIKRRYPDASYLQSQAPTTWTPLSPKREDVSPIYRVRLLPVPDDVYIVKYRAKLNPYKLSQASDFVLWPEEYQVVLDGFSWSELERGLGEGKEGDIRAMAYKALKDVQLVAGWADDRRRAPLTMTMPSRRSGWPPGRITGWVADRRG